MKTYRILARPDIRKAAASWPALSERLLTEAISDVAVRELSEGSFGQVTVDVRLERTSHEAALNEIARLIEQSGYALVETAVTEWISAAAQRAGIAATTFLFGTGATENPLVGLLVSAGATLIAEQAGWVVDRVVAEHTASRDILGNWTLTRIPRPGDAVDEAEAGLSAA